MNKQNPRWITIPEETIHTPVSGSAKKASAAKSREASSVPHKLFWSVGFVAVVVVSFAMLAPQQFGVLIQGNLFDAPGVKEPELAQAVNPLSLLPAKGPEEDRAVSPAAPVSAGTPAVQETAAMQPQTSAVSVSVKPLSVLKEEAAQAETAKAELSANQKLVEELKKQVEDLKTAQATTPPAPAPVLRSSAPEAVGATAVFGANAPYRPNMHRAPVSPQQVLQQNLALGGAPVYSGAATSAATQRADLSRVQGTPESGPREMTAIALLLTFVSLLLWKARRLARG